MRQICVSQHWFVSNAGARAAKLQSPRIRPGVEIVIDAPRSGEAIVVTDSVLLLQFLTNLLSNAAKFTSGGRVMVVCRVLDTQEDSVEFALGVADICPNTRYYWKSGWNGHLKPSLQSI